MADSARINGNTYSWSSVTLKVDGDRYFGITAIGYGDSRERSKAYGMGRHHAPRGRGAGKYGTDPCTATMYKDTFDAFLAALAVAATDGKSVGNVQFQIVVQYVENDISITDEIEDCVLTKFAAKAEENPDSLMVELEIDCMRIRWGGKTLFDQSEGSP